jgi:Nucleotidyltransferase domain
MSPIPKAPIAAPFLLWYYHVRRIDMGLVAFSDIQKFAADVAHEFLPEKVILFGSYATGHARPESDAG